MEFIAFMWNIAWKVVLIGLGFWVFKWVLGDGKTTVKAYLSLACLGLQAGCLVLKNKLLEKLKKEKKALPEGEEDPTRVEAHVV